MSAPTISTFEAETVRACLSRHFKSKTGLAETFLYVTDLATAGSYLSQIVANSDFITMDTEHYKFPSAVSETCRLPLITHFWQRRGPFVATVQLSTLDQNYVFDIVAMQQLPRQLADVFASSKMVKIVFDHKAEAQAVSNSFNLPLINVVDIQDLLMKIQSQTVLGVTLSPKSPTCSLFNVAQTFLGIDLDKSNKHRTWLESTLSAEMLEYAANDSAILIRLLQFIGTVWWLRLVSEKGQKRTPALSSDMVPHLVSLLARYYSSDKKAKLYEDPGAFPKERLYFPRKVGQHENRVG